MGVMRNNIIQDADGQGPLIFRKEIIMGLLNSILGSIIKSLLGGNRGNQSENPMHSIIKSLGNQNQAGGGNLLAGVLSMVQENGGLANLLDMFKKNGMGREADSWVSTSANENISEDQVQQVLGDSSISNLAKQLGMSQNQTSSELAKFLPELVNQLTPGGKLPENHNDMISQGLEMLRRGKD
jgi:uncharacterized protein YidB (DUF937 family)